MPIRVLGTSINRNGLEAPRDATDRRQALPDRSPSIGSIRDDETIIARYEIDVKLNPPGQ